MCPEEEKFMNDQRKIVRKGKDVVDGLVRIITEENGDALFKADG